MRKMWIYEELIRQEEYDENHDGLCVLTDRTDNDDNNDDDDDDDDDDDGDDDDDDDDAIYMMMHEDMWGHYATGCLSVREIKFNEQDSRYDDKGWIISWSYHFIFNCNQAALWMVQSFCRSRMRCI